MITSFGVKIDFKIIVEFTPKYSGLNYSFESGFHNFEHGFPLSKLRDS